MSTNHFCVMRSQRIENKSQSTNSTTPRISKDPYLVLFTLSSADAKYTKLTSFADDTRKQFQASHCQLSKIIQEYRTENGLIMDNTGHIIYKNTETRIKIKDIFDNSEGKKFAKITSKLS